MLTRRDLITAYRLLLRRYGHQHWWPVYGFEIPDFKFPNERTLVRKSCPERLTETDRFQICVGAILTQNTAWTNVEHALSALIRAAPSLKLQAASRPTPTFSPPPDERESERGRAHMVWTPMYFASLPRAVLANLIRPAGYFNQKAKKLQIFSRWLMREHGGSLKQFFRLPTHDCRLQLLSLWGIGPETADSMLLYAGRHPVFVIDAYTKRWLHSDYGLRTTDYSRWTYDEYQRFFMDRLPRGAALYNEFHALIVRWGKDRLTRNKQPT